MTKKIFKQKISIIKEK